MSASILNAVARITPDMATFERDLTAGSERAFAKATPRMEKSAATAVRKAGRAGGGEFVKEIDQAGTTAGRKLGTNGALVRGGHDAGAKAGRAFGMSFDKAGARRMSDTGMKMTAAVTLPLVAGMTYAVKQASDLGETMSATNVIFGASATAMQEWGDQSMTTMGLAKNTALSAANQMGAMLQGIGVAQVQSAKISQQLVERARDVKSLFNAGSTEEVMQAMQSALNGQVEPMRKFGVALSETALKAKAVSAGLVKANVDTVKLGKAQLAVETTAKKAAEATRDYGAGSDEARKATLDAQAAEQSLQDVLAGKVDELDAATKAQAAFLMMMDGTNVAAGDFARTQDSVANKTETAHEKLKQVSGELGEKLLPVASKLLDVFGGFLDFFDHLPGGVQTVVVGLGLFVAAVGPVVGGLFRIVAGWQAVTAAAVEATTAQEVATAAGAGGGAGALGKLGGAAKLGGAVAGVAVGLPLLISGAQGGANGDPSAGNMLSMIGGGAAIGAGIGNVVPGVGTVVGGVVGGIGGGAVAIGEDIGGWLMNARGSVVKARPGGVPSIMAEAGYDEVAAPLDGPSSPFPILNEKLDALAATGPASTVHIEHMTVVSNDPETFMNGLQDLSRKGAAQRHRTRRPGQ